MKASRNESLLCVLDMQSPVQAYYLIAVFEFA